MVCRRRQRAWGCQAPRALEGFLELHGQTVAAETVIGLLEGQLLLCFLSISVFLCLSFILLFFLSSFLAFLPPSLLFYMPILPPFLSLSFPSFFFSTQLGVTVLHIQIKTLVKIEQWLLNKVQVAATKVTAFILPLSGFFWFALLKSMDL